MTARIVVRNRTYFADAGYRREQHEAKLARRSVPRDRQGNLLSGLPIEPGSPAAPYRAGVAFLDPDEQVVYRVVGKLNPLEGWATTDFWQRRWGVGHLDVLRMVQRGLLDAAMEQGSQVRRFRCRDEQQILASPGFKRALLHEEVREARRARAKR